LHSDSQDLLNAIQNLAVDGEAKVKVHQLLEDIETKRKDLMRGLESRRGSDGKIKVLRIKIEQAVEQIANLKEAIRDKIALQNEQQELLTLIEKLTPETESLEDLLENNAGQAQAEFDLEKVKKHLGQVQDQIDTIGNLQTALDNANYKLQELEIFLSEQAQDDLVNLQLAQQQKQPEPENKTAPAFLKFIPGGLGLILLILGVALNLNWLSLFGIVVLTLGVGFYFWQSKKNLSQTPVASKINPLLILHKYKCDSPADLQQKIKEANSLDAKIQSQKESLQTLTRVHSLASLKEQRNDILGEKLDIEKNKLPPEIQTSKISQLELSKYRRELNEKKEQLKDSQDRSIEIRALLKESTVDMEAVVALEEKQEYLQRQEQRLVEEVKVLELVAAGITHAISDVAEASSQLITNEINKYLPRLTEGRYKEVRINSELELLVFSPEKNDWVDPGVELSSGTRDQIYLLARLAFIKLLTKQN
ncbi:MAG: hypothetical protein WCI04_07185, partial [archaeon]